MTASSSVPVDPASALNGDCHSALVDRAALQRAMLAQGEPWHGLVTERCPHLFADVPVFLTAAQMRQMREIIAAVERVVVLPGWRAPSLQAPLLNPLPQAGEETNVGSNFQPLGVFYGYDFHVNEQGAHLIEINTNAGGGFLNALLLDSQRKTGWPGVSPVPSSISPEQIGKDLEQAFLGMFRNEWRLERGDEPLQTIAIVDEQPDAQYLYPEFLLAQRMFERAGIASFIAAPLDLKLAGDGLYLGETKIDLVYNRLTDFSLARYTALRTAYLEDRVVMTPSPLHYNRYADKRNMVRLTDAEALRTLDVSETDIATLQAGVPQTIAVTANMEEALWHERKHWFFKPNTGYGSKGAYRGEKVTKRVFGEILQGDYVAQRLSPPGERSVCVAGAEPALLKYDVRCYVYDGKIQLVAARLYQGQTTNFRTPGGGFAVVRVVE